MADKIPYYQQKSLTREQLLGNRDFLKDASLFLFERTGKTYSKPDKIIDSFMELIFDSLLLYFP